MGTSSSLVVTGFGKRVQWECAADGYVKACLPALIESVAAYGLETLSHELMRLPQISEDDLTREPSDLPLEHRYGDLTGTIYEEVPLLLNRAIAAAEARGQRAVGCDDQIWALDRMPPRFSIGGLTGLFAPRLVVLPEFEDDEQIPYSVDLEEGVLRATYYDHALGREGTYTMDLIHLDGHDAELLSSEIRFVLKADQSDDAKHRLQTLLNTQEEGSALIQQGLNALALARPGALPLFTENAPPRRWGPHKHFLWSMSWDFSDDVWRTPSTTRCPESVQWKVQGWDQVEQVLGALRAMIRAEALPAVTVEHVAITPGQDEDTFWISVDEAPLLSSERGRITALREAMMWSSGLVSAPREHADTGLDTIFEARDFDQAYRADRAAGYALPWSAEPPHEGFWPQLAQTIYSLDVEAWNRLPTDLRSAGIFEADEDETLDRINAMVQTAVLHLTGALQEVTAAFVDQVSRHPLFQAVEKRMVAVERARLRYLREHPTGWRTTLKPAADAPSPSPFDLLNRRPPGGLSFDAIEPQEPA